MASEPSVALKASSNHMHLSIYESTSRAIKIHIGEKKKQQQHPNLTFRFTNALKGALNKCPAQVWQSWNGINGLTVTLSAQASAIAVSCCQHLPTLSSSLRFYPGCSTQSANQTFSAKAVMEMSWRRCVE